MLKSCDNLNREFYYDKLKCFWGVICSRYKTFNKGFEIAKSISS